MAMLPAYLEMWKQAHPAACIHKATRVSMLPAQMSQGHDYDLVSVTMSSWGLPANSIRHG